MKKNTILCCFILFSCLPLFSIAQDNNNTKKGIFATSTGATESNGTNVNALNESANRKNNPLACPTSVSVTITNVSNCSGVPCDGQATVTNVMGGTGPFSYLWSNGQTTQTATGFCPGNANVQVTGGGCTYTENFIMQKGKQSLKDTLHATLWTEYTHADAAQQNFWICFGDCLVFWIGDQNNSGPSGIGVIDTSTGGGPYTYVWSSNVTGATNGPGPFTVCPTSTALVSYTVTVTDQACLSTTIISTPPIKVAPLLLTVNPVNVTCPGLCDGSVQVNANGSPPYTYLWNNGETTAKSSALCAGHYTVSVTNKFFCTSTDTGTIAGIAAIVPTVTSNNIQCGGNAGSATISVTGGTPPYNYLWSNGQTTTAATGLASGNYSVTITDAHGCKHDTAVTIISTGSVTATAGPPGTICAGQTWNLNSTGGLNYVWSSGQTTSSIVIAPTTTTTYSVLVSNGGTCKDSTSVTVTVSPVPVANFSSSIVCFNNATVFTDMSTPAGGLIYSWSFGNTTTSNLQNPSLTYNAAGTYTVTEIVSASAGCKDTIQKVVVINPLPVANFSSTPVCAGNPVCFKDGSTGNNTGWSWNFGDAGSPANISNLQNPCHTFSAAGNFNVTLTVTSDSGCQSTTVLPALVNPKPTANFTSTSPCLNASTALKDASTDVSLTDPIITWNWSMPGGNPTSSTTPNTSTLYTTTGTHTVTLVVTSKGGCSDTIAQPVTVYNPPVPNFSGSGDGCAPLCITNYADSSTSVDGTINGWLWTFPGGTPSTSTAQNPGSICYKDSGAYGASLVVTTSFGCTDSITITPLINVRPWPKADFCITPDKAPATDPVFNFCPLWTPNPGVTNWIWNFGDGSPLDSTSTNPIHSYSASATSNDFYSYTITLLVKNQWGCWDTISKTVELIPEFTFYIPNSFTPNQDGNNEMFFGKGRGIKDYNIWVFDRWGNQLWDCSYSGKNTDWDGPNQDGMPSACKWDGTVIAGNPGITGGSGKLVQQDVYVWKVKLTDVFNMLHTYIGHVSVVK